jgi:DNA-binding protein Fis
VKKETALAKGHWGLHNWLSQVETMWNENKKQSTRADVYQWLDYMRKLTSQHPRDCYTLLYARVGTHLASCVLNPSREAGLEVSGINVSGFIADIDTLLYQTTNADEVHFLCALLNSQHINQKIKEYQTRGALGARDIVRRPFEVVPIPRFNSEDAKHQKLTELSKECHEKVAKLALTGKSIGLLRNKVREHLKEELAEIDSLVKSILT